MLHNLMKPTNLYKEHLKRLRGTKGPIAGNPIYRFLNTKKGADSTNKKGLYDVEYQDISTLPTESTDKHLRSGVGGIKLIVRFAIVVPLAGQKSS